MMHIRGFCNALASSASQTMEHLHSLLSLTDMQKKWQLVSGPVLLLLRPTHADQYLGHACKAQGRMLKSLLCCGSGPLTLRDHRPPPSDGLVSPPLEAKILENLEEKWNDIDRKAITYEVKHQELVELCMTPPLYSLPAVRTVMMRV